MYWIAFFSQTGSEIVEISRKTKRIPDLIVTNNFETKIEYHPGIRSLNAPIMTAKHDKLMQYFAEDNEYASHETLITLHGYLRIVHVSVCDKYSMFNGHPGAIDLYPELKGIDPQIRAYSAKYPKVGSVIHKVTPGVDEGEIIHSVHVNNTAGSADEMFGILKETSLKSWVEFFKKEMYEDWI